MSTEAPSSDPTSSASPRPEKSHSRWTRTAAWVVLGLAALVLLIVVVGEILLHSAGFHNYLLAKAEEKVTAMLGTNVHVENFTVHVSSLSLDVYGVKVDGAAPYRNPPLLLIQHVGVRIGVTSILHRQWYLDNIRVDRPVVRILMAADGKSNIPTLPHSSGSQTNVFTLGIRHAVLDGGEIYYNNRKEALEADLHHLSFQSAFDSSRQSYSGGIRYRDGHLRVGNFSPIPHDFEAQFEATPTSFYLKQAKLTSGQSHIVIVAELKDYSRPNIQAHYDAVFNGGEISRILHNPALAVGVVRTSGDIEYQSNAKAPMLDTLTLNGKLESGQLRIHASRLGVQLRDIAAQYSLANGNAAVQDFRARLFGGELTGTLDMRDIPGNSHSKLNVTLRRLSLADLKRMAPTSSATKDLKLDGIMNAKVNAAWGKTLEYLVAYTDATLQATVAHTTASGNRPSVVPVQGVIHGTYTASTKQIALSQSYLRMPQTKLTMNGTVSSRSALAIQFKSTDLGELETVADLFRTPKPGQPMQSLGLAGSVVFQGKVRGSVDTPHITGQLAASNLQLRGTKWRTLRTNVEASPSSISLQHADLEPASHGNITFNASARLTKWSFTKESQVQIELHASKLDIANMEKLAGSSFPVTGTLAANVSAHGTIIHPVGNGVISLSNAKVKDEPMQSANLIFTGAGNQVQGKVFIHAAGGAVEGVVSLQPDQKSYDAQLTAQGIQLAKLQVLKTRNIEMAGVLNLQAVGQGTFNNPQFNATLQVPQLTVHQQAMQGLTLKMNVANHVATANLDSSVLNTPVRATAKVILSGNYSADATLDTKAISLQPLFAIYAPSEAAGMNGETEIHATLRGPLKDKKLLAIHATLPTLTLSYGNTIQLAAAEPIQMDYKDGVVDLQRTAIRGTDTDLQIQGSIPINRHAAPSLLLQGTVNLQLAQLFSPDVKSSGQMQFDINTYGAKTGSNVEGQVRIVNANFSNGDLPIGMQQGNGVLTLTKDRLNVQTFKATVGSGTLTAQGGILYRPSVQFDLGAVAKGIRLLYPQGVREEMDADLRLTGSEENALLGGRVRIQDMSFTPGFDLMNFVSQLSSGVAAPPAQGFSQNLQLNLAVSSSNNLNLVSRTLSIDGTANLQVRGTAAEPVILGRVNLNNGDLIFNGNRYTLNGGTVEFINPAETQPVVNLALNTTIQQYNIHLRFNGPVDQLRTNYASDPSLPAADIINLLAFGQTTEASTVNPTPGNQAAMSAVASQVSSEITSRVAKSAGISQLSINPVLAGGTTQGPAGAIITIQQRVTGNLFVTFSTNITSTQNQVIMGQYKLSPRVSVSATRDQNGGFGFDTIFKKSW